jgi:ribosomal protein S18 acetylase RimI-like enzyme
VISEKFLRSLTVENSIGLWRDILARPETRPASRLVGVGPDGTIAGMVAWGASRDENPVVGDELLAIDVLSDHHGTGLADLLLMNSIGESSPQMLWVLTANARAQAFYRRYGFLDAGSRQHLDEFEADEMLMLRSG